MTEAAQNVVHVVPLVPGPVTELPSVDVAELEPRRFWDEYVCRHKPLLIKGGARHWPAYSKWPAPGYLDSRCEGVKVTYRRTFNSSPGPEQFREPPPILLSEFFKLARAAKPTEVYSAPHFKLPPLWREDLGRCEFLDVKHDTAPRAYKRDRIFVYRNAGSEWHAHLTDESLTAQLLGAKRVSLFRLGMHNWNDYTRPIEANVHHTRNGHAFFPEVPSIVKLEGILDAGDVIYIPPFWFHGIDPTDDRLGITLAHCFRTPLNRLASLDEPNVRDALKKAVRSTGTLAKVPYLFGLVGMSAVARALSKERWTDE